MKKNLLVIILLLITACDDIIEVEDISGKIIIVLAPSDTSVLTATDINFSWSSIDDAQYYKLQIATPNFEAASQIVLDTTIAATSFSKTLVLGTYEWRVRAENSEYQTTYTTQNFTVEE